MNKDILQGKWEQIKGIIQQNWGKITSDDLIEIQGDYTRLQGYLQEKEGLSEEEAKRAVNDVFGDDLKLYSEEDLQRDILSDKIK